MTSLQSVKGTVKPYLHVVGKARDDVPRVEDAAVRGAIGQLPKRGRDLVRLPPDESTDRSDRLFELAALARDSDISPEITFHLLRSSSNNKFRGREDEALRLWEAIDRSREDEKVRHRVRRPKTARPIGALLARHTQPTEWMVDGIWEHRGWGFVAGEPKTYKSTFTSDLAISVATGTPFLGHFDVCKPGPVLIVQEENSESIQHARLGRIMRHKELAGKIHSINESLLEVTLPDGDCPVYCIDRTRFSFSNTGKRRALESEIKAIQPRLVIFDPLQRIMGDLKVRDENDVTKCLNWMDKVVDSYKCGILIVHHYHKRREEGPQLGGQRMLGSQALHAWLTCGLYIQRTDGNGRLRVDREFRAFDSGPAFELEFDSQDGEDFYGVHVIETPASNTPKRDELLQMVIEKPWLTAPEYAKLMGKARSTIVKQLTDLKCARKKKPSTKGGTPKIVFGPPDTMTRQSPR